MMLAKDQRGFSLFEALAYMMLLGIFLTVIYGIYFQVSHNLTAASKTILTERSNFEAARIMRDDIRQSARIMQSFGPFNATEGSLILLVKNPEQPGSEVIVYRYAGEQEALQRYCLSESEPWKPGGARHIGHGITAFDYVAAADRPRLLTITMMARRSPFGVLSGRPLSFSAYMRNG